MSVDTNSPCPCGSEYPSGVCTRPHTVNKLWDECNRLIAENNHLRTQFEVSQGIGNLALMHANRCERAEAEVRILRRDRDATYAALARANDAIEKQQADLETARHERDEWRELALTNADEIHSWRARYGV